MKNNPTFHVILDFLVHIPLFLVWMTGFVLALMNLGRHPKIAFTVMGALAVALTATIISLLARWALPEIASDFDELGSGKDEFSVLMQIVTFLHTLALAIAFGLLLLASFGWRREETVQPAGQLPADQR